jgi:hypothetical protein
MPLTMRPTGLASPDKDRQDCLQRQVGDGPHLRRAAVPDHIGWFWSLHGWSTRLSSRYAAGRSRDWAQVQEPERAGGGAGGRRGLGRGRCFLWVESSIKTSSSSFWSCFGCHRPPIYSGDWPMGRIYEERGAPEHIRWFHRSGANLPNQYPRAPTGNAFRVAQ